MWAVVLLATVSTTVSGLSVVLAVVTFLAAATAWRAAQRAQGERGALTGGAVLAGIGLVGVAPLAAAADRWAGVVVLAAGVGVVAWQRALGVAGDRPWTEVATGPAVRAAALAVALPGLAGVGLVVLAGEGGEAALVLVLAVCLFDVANAAMGTGETGGVVGAVAGILTLAVLAVAVESVLVPPFTSAGVWILCAVAAVAAPAGVDICRRIAPGRVPALRRLDSLVLTAPAWAVGATVLVHH